MAALASQLFAFATPEGETPGTTKELLPDEPRMVYIGNLPWAVKWQDLKDHMKQAGTVEFAKILTADGSDYGRSRGVAYVRYATENEAKAAIATLNQSELGGRAITVDAWTGSKPKQGGAGFKGGKGAYAFAAMKGAYMGKGWGKGFKGKGWQSFGGKNVKVHGETNHMVYVGNLPFKAEWQELKDHMKTVGTVEFVKILTQDGSDYGASKGIGCVRYSSEAEADEAVAKLNGSELMSRTITVDKWMRRAGKGEVAPDATED